MMKKCHFFSCICLFAWVGALIPKSVFGMFLEGPFGSSPSQRFSQTHQLPVCGVEKKPAAVLLFSGTCHSCPSPFEATEKKPKEYGSTKATYREIFFHCLNTYPSPLSEEDSRALQNYQASICSALPTWRQNLSDGIGYLSRAASGLGLMAHEAVTQFSKFISSENLYFLTSKAVEKMFIRTLTSHAFSFMSGGTPRSAKNIFFAAASFEVTKDIIYRISYVLTENIFFKAIRDEVIPSSAAVNHTLNGPIFNLWELPDGLLFENFKTSNIKSVYANWRDVSIHKQGYFADWIRFSYKAKLKYQRASELYERYNRKNLGTEDSRKTGWEIAEFLFAMLTKCAFKGKII